MAEVIDWIKVAALPIGLATIATVAFILVGIFIIEDIRKS